MEKKDKFCSKQKIKIEMCFPDPIQLPSGNSINTPNSQKTIINQDNLKGVIDIPYDEYRNLDY